MGIKGTNVSTEWRVVKPVLTVSIVTTYRPLPDHLGQCSRCRQAQRHTATLRAQSRHRRVDEHLPIPDRRALRGPTAHVREWRDHLAHHGNVLSHPQDGR